ncbi:uncharacterized protein EV420DRAFT_1633904 [Desarmillaria tabescens]|uniref:Uncharacterized protein n=1 Tax=Armillaria tabescens TaxID=1929756 RepID=A0AA39NPI9_ARMTA|nr:uncharacterized protein EV420DRAFT_1633904 [Desarmillaria tabescens]KAK0469479.1 hypothetical protein EV420DRAFT_1633904 [Desarmillaria tabescens]
MGQRSQTFAIAKVVPYGETKAYYRCVAAWHHQWCYGILPLLAARRFLTLLEQRDNAEIVVDELRRLQGQCGRWESQDAPRIPRVPCSYISFLIGSAWNVDINDPFDSYFHRSSFQGSLLPANMLSGDGESRILSAAQYAREYYARTEDNEDEKLIRGAINALDGVDMVTLDMLTEAWPTVYKTPGTFEPPIIENCPSCSTSESSVPSLFDLALGTTVEQGLATGDTSSLDSIVWMAEKSSMIKAALLRQNPFPDTGLSLLAQVIAQESRSEHEVDLKNFSVNTDQLLSILSDASITIRTLNLSGNANITGDTIRKVLTARPTLVRLVLLNTSVRNEELKELIVTEPKLFYHMQDLIHPFLLNQAESNADEASSYPNAFSSISYTSWSDGIPVASLPFLNPPKIVQGLTDALISYAAMPKFTISNPSLCYFFLRVAFSSAVRPVTRQWSERYVSTFPQESLSALEGEGWCFVLKMCESRYSQYEEFYGFLKIRNLHDAAAGEDYADDPASQRVARTVLESASEEKNAAHASEDFHTNASRLASPFDDLRFGRFPGGHDF